MLTSYDRMPFAPGTFDGPEIHYCEQDCGRMVDDEGVTCDRCLVRHAQSCGDWHQIDIEAAERLNIQHP